MFGLSGSKSEAKVRRVVRAAVVALAAGLTLAGAVGLPAEAASKLKATPTPTISGTAKAGKKLTVKPGTWKPSGVKLTYQWLRDGKKIANATKKTYTLTNADAGAKITVKVKGAKKGYMSVTKTSKAKTASTTTVLSGIKDKNLRACIADALTAAGAVGTSLDSVSKGEAGKIETLGCSGRGIASLSGMPKFANLAALDLSENRIKSLKGLPDAPKLDLLNVSMNYLTDLSGFPKAPKLTQLCLDWNYLSTLTDLPNQPKLTWLRASYNALTSAEGWPALPKLKRLNLEHN